MSDYCQRQPVPGEILSARCEDCGHALVAHIGTDHCPVCELVDLAAQQRSEQPTPVTVTVNVDAHKLSDADWTQLINRLQTRNRISPSQMRY